MLKECIDVFAKELNEKGMNLILDNYIPADGTYIIVDEQGAIKECTNIKFNKKTKQLEQSSLYFRDICFYDYASKLITMNKPVDSKKIIHTNNYFAFAIKKESLNNGKLTETIIDNYFNTLADPLNAKYKKSKEATRIYQEFVNQNGEVNQDLLEKNRAWIKAHIFHLEDFVDIDLKKKDYLKIFFETSEADYQRESNRYILPNIYNKNDYNVEIEGKIYGLPDNNLSMNDKKPYIQAKSKKIAVPYLVDAQDVLLQKHFFDYLMSAASKGQYNVYVDTENNLIRTLDDVEARADSKSVEKGYYLRIKKGTEVEILAQDNLVDYSNELKRYFNFKNILQVDYAKNENYLSSYGTKTTRTEIGALINEVFFYKYLQTNYFTEASDIKIYNKKLLQNILFYRHTIFNWIFKGIDNNFSKSIDNFALELIKDSVLTNFCERAIWQFNLWWSLDAYLNNKEQIEMADIVTDLRNNLKEKLLGENPAVNIDSDREYFYAVGQLAYYFNSLSKTRDKTQALINPIINVKNIQVLRDRLFQLWKKYNYDISLAGSRVNRLLALVFGYIPDGNKIQQDIILLGYIDNSIVYVPKKKIEEQATEEQANEQEEN